MSSCRRQAEGLKHTRNRTMTALSKGQTPGPESSIGKVINANQMMDIANTAIESLDHYGVINDPELVFREIRRVLRPGGLYVGSTFAEAPSLLGRLAARAAGIRRFETAELRSPINDQPLAHVAGAAEDATLLVALARGNGFEFMRSRLADAGRRITRPAVAHQSERDRVQRGSALRRPVSTATAWRC